MSAATQIPEEELVKLLKARDEKAVKHLYTNYSAALYGVIFRIVQKQETAEELLQEVFLRAWHSAAAYDRSKGRLYTWMLNIARNVAIDKTRSSGFKQDTKTVPIDSSVYTTEQTQTVQPEQELLDVKDIVERLRPEQKELIDLIYFYGYTQAEAAGKLKIPLGTVKTRVRSAVAELRKYFVSR